MSTERMPLVYCGPSGCFTVNALVDSGADKSVIPADLAQALGLPTGRPQVVRTSNGLVTWARSTVAIGLPNQPVMNVDAWIAPAGTEPSLGADGMLALGFAIVPPSPVNYDELAESGYPVPATEGVWNEDSHDATSSAASLVLPEMDRTAARLSVCSSCSAYTPTPLVGARCSDCGCLIALKTRLPGSSCPRGKW